MSPSLTVRRIAAHQGAVLRELRPAVWGEAPYGCGETLEEALSADVASFDETADRHANSPATASFILYTEGHPAGLVGAFIDEAPAPRAFVYALWVAPAVRHLRGGELLVNAATQWLAERRVHDVFSWVTDENRKAMRFYERLGFGPTGERRRIPAHPEEYETLLVRRVSDHVT